MMAMSQTKRYAIIPAGGNGSRMGLPYPKQLLKFGMKTVLERVVGLFQDVPVYVAAPLEYVDLFKEKLEEQAHVIAGGETRFESVKNAFEAIMDLKDCDLVLIHDAARPFLDGNSLEEAWAKAAKRGALVYASKAIDTMKEIDATGRIIATLDREFIYHAQTPQIFRADLLRKAYAAASQWPEFAPTDEASLLERAGLPVFIFPASPKNRKLTTQEDLELLKNAKIRIGHGYDVHRFDKTRPLYLGGVLVPDSPGLMGHSDADAALHALIDALLGAAGLGDIGHHFPDNDPALKGIRSTVLLEKAWADLSGRGYHLVNADLTIEAQTPKLAPFISEMRATIAALLGAPPEIVNIKATTTEGLGFVGRKEGVAASAAVLISQEASA